MPVDSSASPSYTMSETLTDAIREAYATAQSDVLFWDTIEIRNPDADPVYLIQDRVNRDLTLETGVTVTFIACGFRLSLPSSGDNGVQELGVSIDNVDRGISQFLRQIAESSEDIRLIYRPYMSSDTTRPQMDPPLVLFLSDIVVNAIEVVGRAAFADILNRKFLTETYNPRRFPAL